MVIRAWLGKKNINKRHFAWGNTPVKPPFPPGEIHQESGEPGSRTRAKLAIPVAEEPAAFARAFQASKVFGDFNGEVIGISRT